MGFTNGRDEQGEYQYVVARCFEPSFRIACTFCMPAIVAYAEGWQRLGQLIKCCTAVLTLLERRRRRRAALRPAAPARRRGGSRSREIAPEAPDRPLVGFAGLIADAPALEPATGAAALHGGGRGSPGRCRRRGTVREDTRTSELRRARRERDGGPSACLLSVDTEHGRSFFPRDSESAAFAMPSENELKSSDLSTRPPRPSAGFGRFSDEDDRCRG